MTTGIYGLSEAAHEIDEHKKMITVRDNHIRDLTGACNDRERIIEDLADNVAALRMQLGY